MLVGTDVCVRVVFVWEETGIPGGNPPVWLGDHMTISHADAAYWTRVAAVRGEHVTTSPARQPLFQYIAVFNYNTLISNIKYILQNRTESWKWHQNLKFVSECFFVKLLTYKCFCLCRLETISYISVTVWYSCPDKPSLSVNLWP